MYGAPRPLKELLRRIRPVGNGDAGAAGLAGDPAQRDAAAEIEGHAIEVGVGAGTGNSGHASLGAVEAELGFVQHRRREHLVQAGDRVLRDDGGVVQAEGGILGLRGHALIAEIACVEAVLRAEVVIEADAAGVFAHAGRSGNVDDIEQRVRGGELSHREGAEQGADGRRDAVGGGAAHAIGARANGCAQRALHDGRGRLLPQAFEAGEEEGFVLIDRSADGAAELVQAKLALGGAIEEIARVHGVVAQVFEGRTVKSRWSRSW